LALISRVRVAVAFARRRRVRASPLRSRVARRAARRVRASSASASTAKGCLSWSSSRAASRFFTTEGHGGT